jgi:hypothetical protein
MPPANPSSVTLPPPAPPAPRWFAWLGALALVGYALFLAANTTVVAGGSDSSGYLNSARLLASGHLQTDLRVPAEFGPVTPENWAHFSPAGFNHFPGNPHLAPVYPTGFPLHLALAGRLLGWDVGPFLVQLLAALLAVWLTYRVGRELGLPYPLAATGAAILAAFPVFIFTSIQTLSDTLATTWTLAALLCGLRAGSSVRWAAACGAAFAIAVLVRPTNFLMAPALVWLVARDLRRFAWFVLAGLPGAAWLLFYNHRLYGGAFQSGYGNIYADFGREYVAPTAVHFIRWLTRFLPVGLLVLPAFALGRRDTRHRGLFALLLAGVPGFVLYLFYGISHEAWWCLRFILPGLPGLILAGLLGVEAIARGAGARWPTAFRGTVALVLTAWAAGSSVYWLPRLTVFYVPVYERAYAAAAREIQARVPPGAIIVSSLYSGAVYYYTDLPVLNFDAIQAADFAHYAALARAGRRPLYAVIFREEENTALRVRCPGPWTKITAVDNIGIWRLP